MLIMNMLLLLLSFFILMLSIFLSRCSEEGESEVVIDAFDVDENFVCCSCSLSCCCYFFVSYDVQRKEVVGMSSCCPKRQTQWLMISLL